MSEEERGFVIRDRRGRGGESAEGVSSIPGETGASGTEKQSESAGPRAKEEEQARHAPPNFLSFVYSLGTSALMLLGENPAQQASAGATNLGHAQEIIDILTILETKTKGNLTQEEETLLQEMLYTLRIKYVDKASTMKA